MDEKELNDLLDELIALDSENEVLEFKEAKNNFDFDDIWKYFSALSNEANLKNKRNGWLVFGIENKKHELVWTKFKENKSKLHKLKEDIWNHTNSRITFQEIYELERNKNRVILFQIPAAPRWIPTEWKWHYYARDHESLQPLNIEKIERIRKQWVLKDWSLNIIENATIDDLDEEAIKKAREKYLQKNSDKKQELEQWDNKTFLNKAKITIKWKITNTAIILLWKEESEHYLSPAVAKISWILENRDWVKIDYQHFSCPFILSAEKVFNKIRNLKYRYMNNDSLFPEEVDMYDPYIIRESLNNCIAHQDYELWWKINIIEKEDSLIFINLWKFIPETIENVIKNDSPSEYYRNKFLSDAMVNINLIDTIWSWIQKMFIIQKNKYFPLPEYELSNNKVSLTIDWKILDLKYARKLALSKNNLTLDDIILLDKIQKNKELSYDEIKYLRKKKFIEWRNPNFHISYEIAEWTELVWDYILQKSNIEEQRDKILKFISWYKKWVSKKEIMNFVLTSQIFEKLLTNEQKETRLENILYSLKKLNKIESKWKWADWLWFKK